MPYSEQRIVVPYPQGQVDIDAARLALAKLSTPGATNSNGVVITHIGPVTGNNNSTVVIATVWT